MKKKRPVTLALIGTDGSGKTTITNAVANSLGREKAIVVWCGAESYLMKPVRFFLSLVRKNKAEVERDDVQYTEEIDEKVQISKKYGKFEWIYIFLVLMDYRIQYLYKMWKCRNYEYVIFDRYFFDVAVNLAITLGWPPEKLVEFIQRKFSYYKFPDLRGFVYVPPEVSMSRKDDVPDVTYLQLRTSYYRAIAASFDFLDLDGEKDINKNADYLVKELLGKEKEIRIHYVHSNNEDVGGADFCLHRMVELFNEKDGYSCAVSLRRKTKIFELYESSSIPIYYYDFCRPQLSRGWFAIALLPIRALFSFVYFVRLFRTQLPDIVHVNDLYDFIPALAAKCTGAKVVYHIRMIRQHETEVKFFAWLMRNFSDKSFSVSEAVRECYFPFEFRSPDHGAVVIRDWPLESLVNLSGEFVKPDEFHNYDTVVVMIGRLEWWKGQHIFLDAVEKVRHKVANVGFFMIGGSVKGDKKEQYANEVIEKAERIGVHYLGERSDVDCLLRAADISVHASVTPDPFPGVVIESLLSESATIGASAGGVKEMIRNGVDGLLYEPGNSQALAESMLHCISQPEKAKEMAKSGRKNILELTNKQLIAQKTDESYKDLICTGA